MLFPPGLYREPAVCRPIPEALHHNSGEIAWIIGKVELL
jgi:hypothetical protein